MPPISHDKADSIGAVSDEWTQRYPPVSRVGKTDQVIRERDEDWTVKDADWAFFEQHLYTFPADYNEEPLKSDYAALREVIGDRSVEVDWVVHSIVATRK